MIKKIGFVLALVVVVSLLSVPVMAAETTPVPSESSVSQETTATTSESARTYTVSAETTRAYALINKAYLSLEISYSRGTEVVATPQGDGYALLADGTYLLLSDLAIKPVESVTPHPTIEPLPTTNKGNGLVVLAVIFLVSLGASGFAGYAIRGYVEKKRWVQDPYRFDELLSAEKPSDEPEAPKEKKRTVLDKMLEKRKEPKVPKEQKPKPEKAAKVTVPKKTESSYIVGGTDDAGRTFYYEPEEIDPEGNPFWLDNNGKKHYYE